MSSGNATLTFFEHLVLVGEHWVLSDMDKASLLKDAALILKIPQSQIAHDTEWKRMWLMWLEDICPMYLGTSIEDIATRKLLLVLHMSGFVSRFQDRIDQS